MSVANFPSLSDTTAGILAFTTGMVSLLYGFVTMWGVFYGAPGSCAPGWGGVRIHWAELHVQWHANCTVYGTSAFTVVGLGMVLVACVIGLRAGFDRVSRQTDDGQ